MYHSLKSNNEQNQQSSFIDLCPLFTFEHQYVLDSLSAQQILSQEKNLGYKQSQRNNNEIKEAKSNIVFLFLKLKVTEVNRIEYGNMGGRN